MQHLKNKNAKDKRKLEERKQKEKNIKKNEHYATPTPNSVVKVSSGT